MFQQNILKAILDNPNCYLSRGKVLLPKTRFQVTDKHFLRIYLALLRVRKCYFYNSHSFKTTKDACNVKLEFSKTRVK